MKSQNLQTNFVKLMNRNKPWHDYPRPQLKRESYLNINGLWDYKITTEKSLPTSYDGKILVPFPLESNLSGVAQNLKEEEYLFYRTNFKLPKGFIKDIVLLHFGAVDQEALVYLNGIELGQNCGGYIPFTFEITRYLQESNELIVRVKDNLDYKYPYGKQSKKPGGIWYTQISGIWQTVWLESVSQDYIEKLHITPNIDQKSVSLAISSQAEAFTIKILTDGIQIYHQEIRTKEITIPISILRLWTPNEPYLYKLIVMTKNDQVESYFAMRKVGISEFKGKKVLTLNNEPYFFNGLLDQGFYPDGLYLPPTIDGFIYDIIKMKELGFNTLRKHIKVEPLIWYNLCDKLGMIVWQDMVNNSPYSLVEDTIFPLIGFKNKSDEKMVIPEENKKIFLETMEKTVDLLYNSPSIVLWTIFNEGWGQFNSVKVTERLKKIDATRLIDSTSGWFDQKVSDLSSLHIYFKKIKLKKDKRPQILSEFGGYAYKIPEHSYILDKTFGYRYYNDELSFRNAFVSLYEEQIIPNIAQGLAAAIYTQVSDVEEETNGILTYDRQICKLDVEQTKELNSRVKYRK
ncbi:MAG TPA: glycoside hydrolase family 2 TIM barrel-domain containing protein [Bacilli bacterium]|nr:glycoside hydrolase family 2 TIM barrel-domain containing protein [Bacilli bacterium]